MVWGLGFKVEGYIARLRDERGLMGLEGLGMKGLEDIGAETAPKISGRSLGSGEGWGKGDPGICALAVSENL